MFKVFEFYYDERNNFQKHIEHKPFLWNEINTMIRYYPRNVPMEQKEKTYLFIATF